MYEFAHWPTDTVQELFYVKGRIGWRGLKRKDFSGDGPYLITGMHINDSGGVDWDACFRIPQRKYDESPEIMVSRDDLVITKDGTIGKVAYIDSLLGPTSLNSHLFLVRPKASERIQPRFAFHIFRSAAFQKFIERQKSGSTLAGLSEAKFLCFRVPTPDASEQRKCVEVLDALDNTISCTEAMIGKLERVKQALMHDLLTRGINANGELRPSSQDAARLYRASQLGPIPEGWNVLGLRDMGQSTRTVLKTGPFGSSLKGEHLTDTGRPVVTIGSLGVGRFIEEALLYVSEATAKALIEYELIPGDIAFSRVADVGRSVVVEDAQRGWIMSSNFMRISTDATRVLPELLQSVLAFDARVKRQIRSTVNSAGRDVASSAILMSLRFAVPPLPEQAMIVDRMKAAEAHIAREHEHLEKLGRMKSGLMDDIFTGRVRVTNVLDTATA